MKQLELSYGNLELYCWVNNIKSDSNIGLDRVQIPKLSTEMIEFVNQHKPYVVRHGILVSKEFGDNIVEIYSDGKVLVSSNVSGYKEGTYNTNPFDITAWYILK